MGYSTNFEGEFKLDKPLSGAHAAYLRKFSKTRRMRCDSQMLARQSACGDPERLMVDLRLGDEGGYYVGSDKWGSPHILDYNTPPKGQPGLWCQWIPNETNDAIVWDGGEKFYNYAKWLAYLIEHFLAPWGYTLNGAVTFQGEDQSDFGQIGVVDNYVVVTDGVRSLDLETVPELLAKVQLARHDYLWAVLSLSPPAPVDQRTVIGVDIIVGLGPARVQDRGGGDEGGDARADNTEEEVGVHTWLYPGQRLSALIEGTRQTESEVELSLMPATEHNLRYF